MRSQEEISNLTDDKLCAEAYEAAHHKLTQLNPELALLVDELIVRVFPSTRNGNHVTGDILNGPDKGKQTTVFIDQIAK